MLSTYTEHYGHPSTSAAVTEQSARDTSDGAVPNRETGVIAVSQQVAADEELAKQLHEQQVDEFFQQADGSQPKLTEDVSRDLSVATCLSVVNPVKVVPRVNSVLYPAQQEISRDRQRLLTRLDHYGLAERVVKGDGNCQFRSLSDQLYRSPMYWREVRLAVLEQLQAHPDWYQGYVPGDYREYCASMALPGTWGDHVTLQAAADLYGLGVKVLTSFEESPVITVEPRQRRSSRVLWLCFWAEVHYNSLYPGQEPPVEAPQEKLLGSRRLARLVHDGEWPTY